MKKSLNSRERVLTALSHREPDRVPMDMGGGAATGLVGHAHNRLLVHLGLRGDTKVWFPYVQWCVVDPKVIERFDIDCINVVPMPDRWREGRFSDGTVFLEPEAFNPKEEPDGSRIDIYGGVPVGRMPPDGNWFDPIYFPLADATVDDLDGFSWMPPFSFYRLPDVTLLDNLVAGVRETAHYWYENSDKALVGFAGASIFETAQGLRGFEQLYIDFVQNRKFVDKLLDTIADANVEFAKRYCEAIADYAQIIVVGGEDIGAQGMLQIRPEIYREMVMPRIKRLWQTFKKNTDAYLYVHSCGYIEPVIEDFIDAGIDIINPVQIGAGMNAKQLKERYGRRVTFWGGGVDTQHTLTQRGVEDVRSQVKERIGTFAPGGGYVFAAEQTIQAEVPPGNVVAMYDAAKEFGVYPVSRSL